MKNRIFNNMLSNIIFQIILCTILFQTYSTAPINSSVTYDKFLEDIKRDHCFFPNGVKLPFESSKNTFEYLAIPLSICNTPESSKPSKEAMTLCKNVFDTLKNVTCYHDGNPSLQEINIEFSKNVCSDINVLKFTPSQESFLKHLTDKYICEMICDEDYKSACEVLLWSYLIQQEIEKTNIKKEQTPVAPLAKDVNLILPVPETKAIVNNVEQEKQVSLAHDSTSSLLDTETKNIIKGEGNKTSAINSVDENVVETSNKGHAISSPSYNKVATDNKSITDSNKVETNNASNKTTDKIISPETKYENARVTSNDLLTNVEENNNAGSNLIEQNKNENNETIKVKEETNIANEENNNGKEEANKAKEESNNPKEETSNAMEETSNPKEETNNPKAETTEQKVDAIENPNPSNGQNKKQEIVEENPANQINPVLDGKVVADKINDDPKFKSKVVEPVTEIKNSDINAAGDKENLEASGKNVFFEPVSTSNGLPVESDNQAGDKKEITKQLLDSENKITQNNNEASPKTTLPNLEKMEGENEIPRPLNQDQDAYNMENEHENEYKLDYDGDDGFFDSTKNKNPLGGEMTNAKIPEPAVNQNDMPEKPKSSFGREPDEIDMLPAFPEQEDSHFFFYFLSIIFILMGGYLLFHNKQKILALIVEGRHERRRRSHGVGYKKLDTK